MNIVSPDPVAIGHTTIAFPFGLSPMAGYTDSAMRRLCFEHGCGFALTEVANARALARGCRRTRHLLHADASERPLGAHIYGSDPDALAAAAEWIEAQNRFDFIDLNAGCPVRKIVARGAGAALTRTPAKLESLVRAMTSRVKMPVTVKTRVGWTSAQTMAIDLARAAEQGGASMVSIHARFAEDKHSGPAHWGLLSAARQSVSIPVMGNGGVECAADALNMVRDTGVSGVLIGRAAVGNPWIFDRIRRLCAGEPDQGPSLAEIRKTALRQLESIISLKRIEYAHRQKAKISAEHAGVLQFRAHLARYLTGMRGWSSLRRRLEAISSIADIEAGIDEVFALQRETAGG